MKFHFRDKFDNYKPFFTYTTFYSLWNTQQQIVKSVSISKSQFRTDNYRSILNCQLQKSIAHASTCHVCIFKNKLNTFADGSVWRFIVTDKMAASHDRSAIFLQWDSTIRVYAALFNVNWLLQLIVKKILLSMLSELKKNKSFKSMVLYCVSLRLWF